MDQGQAEMMRQETGKKNTPSTLGSLKVSRKTLTFSFKC